ncbi:hypothetical protein [Agathobaculum sp.]|uniref:hypothetical protein n=1 Tax=Agathobaculum sp. TaxID=2048138 RepID=UPI002A81BB88|nr:hypothetical protein [Agathobaculum sp.]MDY3617774.1 hypothetical protein [Agathobaculum sp.]
MSEQNTGSQKKYTAVCYDNGVVYLVSKHGQVKKFPTKSEAKEYVKARGGRWKQLRANRDMASCVCAPEPVQLNGKVQRTFYRIMTEPPADEAGDWRTILLSLSTGYIARMIDKLGLEPCPRARRRAPIYRIEADSDDLVRDELERLAKVLVPNHVDFDVSQSKSPVLFPENYNGDRLESSAYFKVKRARLPMQYRDTAVIIDQRMLKKGEAERFLDENPWASVLLITKKNQKIERCGILPVQLNEAGFPLGKKKTEAVRLVMQAFEQCLQDICRIATDGKKKHRKYQKQIKAMWRALDTCMKRVNVNKRDYFWPKLRLLSADLLAKFVAGSFDKLACADGSDVSRSDISQTCQPLWRNLILPGCCPMSEPDVPLEEKNLSKEDYPELFRRTVAQTLNDLTRLPYIPRGSEKEICPECAEDDPGFRYYGYRRTFEIVKTKEQQAAVFFVRDEFLEQFEKHCPCKCDAKEVLSYCENSATPKYFAPQKKGSRKARIPRALNDNKPVPSVILMLDELDFLPDDLRERLLETFKQEKN